MNYRLFIHSESMQGKFMSTRMVTIFCFSLTSGLLLTGCGGSGGSTNPSGEIVSEDDVGANAGGVDTGSQLRGIWDLTGNWDGVPGDVAYFVIDAPDSNDNHRIAFYDYDGDPAGDGLNCYIFDSEGFASFDNATGAMEISGIFPFSGPVFLDELGTTLTMQIHGRNGGYSATRVLGLTESSFNVPCN